VTFGDRTSDEVWKARSTSTELPDVIRSSGGTLSKMIRARPVAPWADAGSGDTRFSSATAANQRRTSPLNRRISPPLHPPRGELRYRALPENTASRSDGSRLSTDEAGFNDSGHNCNESATKS
jgi:hypothetical protein